MVLKSSSVDPKAIPNLKLTCRENQKCLRKACVQKMSVAGTYTLHMMLEDILWVGKVWLIRVPGIHPGPSVARMLIRPGIVGRRTNHQKKPLIIRSKDSRVGQHMPYTSSCAIAKLFGGWLFCQLVVSLLEVASRPASNTGFSRRPWDGSNLSLWKTCLCLMSFCSSQLFLGQVTTANIAWVKFCPRLGSASTIDIANMDSTNSHLQEGQTDKRPSGCSPENIAQCLCHWRWWKIFGLKNVWLFIIDACRALQEDKKRTRARWCLNESHWLQIYQSNYNWPEGACCWTNSWQEVSGQVRSKGGEGGHHGGDQSHNLGRGGGHGGEDFWGNIILCKSPKDTMLTWDLINMSCFFLHNQDRFWGFQNLKADIKMTAAMQISISKIVTSHLWKKETWGCKMITVLVNLFCRLQLIRDSIFLLQAGPNFWPEESRGRNLRHRSKQELSVSEERKLWKVWGQLRKETIRFQQHWMSFFRRPYFPRISKRGKLNWVDKNNLYWMLYFRGVSFPRINTPKLNWTTSQSEPELISLKLPEKLRRYAPTKGNQEYACDIEHHGSS